jgi:hypothetical protein
MRKANSDRNGSGLTEDRLGLVHRYMVEAPPEPPRKVRRWTPSPQEPVVRPNVAPHAETPVGPERASVSAPPVQAPTPPEPRREVASSAEVVPLRPEPPADLKRAVAQEPAAPPAASVEPELEPEREIEPEAEVEIQAEPEVEVGIEPEIVAEAAAVEDPLEAFEAAETEDGSRAADLPIHLWVRVPGANGADANPGWPQELVREGLERSLRARDRGRDRDY